MQTEKQIVRSSALADIDEISLREVLLGQVTTMREFIASHRKAAEENWALCAGNGDAITHGSHRIVGKYTAMLAEKGVR